MPDLGTDEFVDLEEIGRGGYGIVYRAHQPAFRRTVAIKVLTSVDDETRRRFVRERYALGAVSSHPNIPEVFGSGMTPSGSPYIAMAYMSGGSYEELIAKQGPLSVKDAVRAAVKIAAVETAHRSGVLHRDIKPDNVLLSPFGEPQLADFGIAALAGATRTKTGSTPASLAYAAPEVLNRKKPTVRSDVYSLGVTLFALVAGYPPFWKESDESIVALMVRTVQDPLPDLRPAGVPHEVCEVMEQATRKHPDERYGSAASLGEALRSAQAKLDLPVTEMVLQQPLTGEDPEGFPRSEAEGGDSDTVTADRRSSPELDTRRVPRPRPSPPGSAPGMPPGDGAARQRRRWPIVVLVAVSIFGLGAGGLWVARASKNATGSRSPDVASPRGALEPEDVLARRVVTLINDTRREQGLGELVVDPELAAQARTRASQNARAGTPDTTPNLSSLKFTADYISLGENEGSGTSVESIHEATLNSPKHLDKLKDPTFNAVGVGVAYSSDAQVLFVVEYFGQQRSAPVR